MIGSTSEFRFGETPKISTPKNQFIDIFIIHGRKRNKKGKILPVIRRNEKVNIRQRVLFAGEIAGVGEEQPCRSAGRRWI
jgi:hypothetical protein